MDLKSYLTKKNIIIGIVVLIALGAIGSIFDDEEKSEIRAIAPVAEKSNTASDKIILFKDYIFGMTPGQVKEISGASSCNDPELKDALCSKKKVNFAGYNWDQIFVFVGDKLSQVVLHKEGIDLEQLQNIAGTIVENGFVPANVYNGALNFDLLESLATVGPKDTDSEMNRFIDESIQNDAPILETSYLPEEYMKKLVKDREKYYLAGIDKAPKDLRLISVTISDEDVGIQFQTPAAFSKSGSKKAFKEKF